MKLQNIIKIVSAIFGVLAVVFLFRIIGLGDEEIKMAASMGDYGSVTPLVNLAIGAMVLSGAKRIFNK
ncbi:MAG: hypothetical protein VW892_06980 [Flavobacteriaceae bacterium]